VPAAGAAAPTPARSAEDTKKAEAELAAVKSEIERVTRQVSAEQVERDRLTKDLRSAELSVGHARESLSDVRKQRAEHAARRAALATEQATRERELTKNRTELAGQMRAAYLIGRQEPL
jgi:murein hydrolase activator